MVRVGLVACFLVAGLAFGPARAAEGIVHEVKIGVLKHDVPDLWSGFSRERGWDLSVEAVFTPELKRHGGVIRPHAGFTINNHGATSMIFGGGVLEWNLGAGFFASVGVGAALHNGETRTAQPDKKELGSKLLFHIPLEAGYELTGHHRISAYFAHVSNGFLASPNEGMDQLGLRYGYKF